MQWSPSEDTPASPSDLQTAVNQDEDTAKRLILAGGLVTAEIEAQDQSKAGPVAYLAPPGILFGGDPKP